MSNLLNGVSGLAIGAYIVAVLYQSVGANAQGGTLDPTAPDSNLSQLIANLEQDYGYLEFLLAAGALALLVDVPALRPLVGALIGVAVFAVLVKGAGAGGTVLDYLSAFGKGKIGLFGESKASSSASPAASPSPSPNAPAKTSILPTLPALPALTSA